MKIVIEDHHVSDCASGNWETIQESNFYRNVTETIVLSFSESTTMHSCAIPGLESLLEIRSDARLVWSARSQQDVVIASCHRRSDCSLVATLCWNVTGEAAFRLPMKDTRDKIIQEMGKLLRVLTSERDACSATWTWLELRY
jgi:hypothetical protein